MENKIYQPNLKPPDTIVNLNNSTQQNFEVSNNQIFPPQTNYLNNPAQNPNNILPTNNLSQGNQLPKTQRKIYVDLQDGTPVIQPEQYCKNNVRTSQYTILSFLPLALINQYKNPFNIFFLVMMIINCIPAISPSSPVTTIIPVVVVLIINLIREAAEDFKKHRNDRRANDAPCYIYKSPKFVKEKCKNINVGNIIRVKKDEEIPADLLIIKSSLDTGFCYMQTANLDGETALKPREAIYTSNKKLRYKYPKTFKRLLNPINDNCFIEIDLPNENIYEINGTIIFKGQKTYFDSKNVLLRGSRLKSVDYVFGVAVYTGKETKLMKNIVRAKLKKADIEKKLLYIIIFLIGFSIFLTILGGVIGIIYRNRGLPDYEDNDFNEGFIYYYRRGSSKKTALEIVRLFSAHLHLSIVIPISVMVLNTLIKVFQSQFLENSQRYREDKGDKIKCYSQSLIEQLGKVKYIFSDKTGTLTKNEMIFKGCSIYTNLFDSTISETGKVISQKKFMPLPRQLREILSISETLTDEENKRLYSEKKTPEVIAQMETATINSAMDEEENEKVDSKITPDFCFDYFFKCLYDKETKLNLKLKDGDKAPFMTLHEVMEHLLLNIAINHDVLVEKRTEKKDVVYQGISPDEVTLVSMADELGYTFLSRENEKIVIEVYNYEKEDKELREFQILKKFDFTSERQCSSIIVKDLKTNKILVYIKGSDRKIINSVDSFSSKYICEPTQEHIDQFAHQGLRTLCYSLKTLEESEYNTWVKEYEDTRYLVTKDKSLSPQLDALLNKLESNGILLGATALEDKLQDRVKRDIEDFIEADINFWMITGDKMATAETIGHSCGIISEDSEVFKIRENKSADQILEQLEMIKQNISKSDQELQKIIHHHNKKLEKMKTMRTMRAKKTLAMNQNTGNYNFVQNYANINNRPDALQINNPMNNPQINQYQINQYLNNQNNQLNQNNIFGQNLNSNKLLYPLNNNPNIINNNLDNKSEDSADPSEILAYLKQFEEADDEYLEEISNIQENEELYQRGIALQKNITHKSDKKDDKQNSIKNKTKSFVTKTTRQLNTDRIEYMKAYDYFQEKQNEFTQVTKRRCFLFKMKYIYPQPDKVYEKNKKISSKYTLIIEGSAINTCIDDERVSKVFYELIKDSRSLICCRSSPSQKSKIVNFIKQNSDELTLAIGDGGNDVNMIKAAGVGIGIFGKEGYQAAYNSDYAISQFKYLKRLMFVDGRFSLARNSYFIYHYFYKNVIYRMSQYWFQIFNEFSGKSLIDDLYATGFNSFFTIFQLTAYAIIEEDFDADFTNHPQSDKVKLPYLFPDIYKEFRESMPFNIIKFIFIYIVACIISCIFFLIPAFSFYEGTYGTRGIVYSFWDVSWQSLFCMIIIHFAMVFEDTFLYVKFNIFANLLQIVICVVVLVALNESSVAKGMDDTLWFMMGNLNFWLSLVMVLGAMFVPFFILRNAEFFFGGFLVPLILQKRIDHIYFIKYCQKKVDEMTRINRRVAKFMKLYKNPQEADKVDNFADKQMQEIVNQFKKDRVLRKNISRKKTLQPYLEKIKTKKTMAFRK